VNFCGQPGARLDVDKSLYGESKDYSKKIIFRVMNVVLFGSPDGQSKAFHKILVDGMIVDSRWKQYMDKLNSDWNGYTIFVSCCCFILLIRSMTMLVYCDACCKYQLSRSPICPGSNVCDPSILHVYPLRHGLVSSHTIIGWASQ
jgi:hypothetical protein